MDGILKVFTADVMGMIVLSILFTSIYLNIPLIKFLDLLKVYLIHY